LPAACTCTDGGATWSRGPCCMPCSASWSTAATATT